MGKTKHHHHHGDPESESVGFHRPYWRSAHKDWRLWIAVSLMLVAMFMYIASDNLALRPRSQSQPPPSSAGEKQVP